MASHFIDQEEHSLHYIDSFQDGEAGATLRIYEKDKKDGMLISAPHMPVIFLNKEELRRLHDLIGNRLETMP